jgi:calcium-dependent protein kinase
MECDLAYETIDSYQKRYIRKYKKNMPEEDCAIVMKQIFNALKYMHDTKNIIHRDLKPLNIMLREEDNLNSIILIDFGFATEYK